MTCKHRQWLSHHRKLVVVLLATALATASYLIDHANGPSQWLMILAAGVAGFPVVRLAIAYLHSRQFSIPLLVAIAAAGAIWIGEAWEAAAVTILYMLGSYLEELTLDRTRTALRALVDMAPRTARIKRGEALEIIPAEAVQAGEYVVILPGDRVAVDGLVTAGRAALETAALTGEPLPAEVGPGDRVLSGSISQGGYLEILAEQVGPDTTFSRMIYLVADAQEQKPRVQRFVDRFARWYTPSVIAAAVLIYLIARDARMALTFLVIGCPGALVVAAPVATVAGLGRAARHGVLIKGGERLEQIARVDVVAFDKTGTLTLGRPQVTALLPFAGATAEQVLALAAGAEQRSEHHLAAAILAHAAELDIAPAPATDWSLEPGLGATAQTAAGEVLVGNRRLLQVRDVTLGPAQETAIQTIEAQGATLALVALAGRPIGVIAITDPLRPEATGLVSALHRAGVRQTVMLTGDHAAAAHRVAGELGIDQVQAGLSPAEKVAAIRRLQAEGHRVAMIGDGVNDAPALAAANVSIAMGGSGTQAAIEAADITLMSDRLSRIPFAIHLSRRIMAVVRQNLILAVAVVLLLLAGVLGGTVHLGSGMLVHQLSLLAVIANGMRLLGVTDSSL